MAEDRHGQPQFFEVGLVVSRQNGKDAAILALELGWLFLFNEPLIIHSAHLFKTSGEHFRRLEAVLENWDDLRRRVKAIRRGKGDEQVELNGGQRIEFMTRKGGAGRGFTAGKIVLNEAMFLDSTMMASALPTLATVPTAQVLYAGSAGMRHSTQLSMVRRRAYAEDDPALAYLEWTADERPPPDGDDRADPATWAKTNPGFGIRITEAYIRKEMAALGGPYSTEFGTERLGIGDWPPEDEAWEVIGLDPWTERGDSAGIIPDGADIALALDADADRQCGTIAVCGFRDDGRRQVEVVERHRGTGWMVEAVRRMCELAATWRPCVVVVLRTGAAASLIKDLEAAKVNVYPPADVEYAQACGLFQEAFTELDTVRHFDQPSLNKAVAGARKRELAEGGWRWSRKLSTSDVSPVVAATLALWGHMYFANRRDVWVVGDVDPDLPASAPPRRGPAGLASALRRRTGVGV
jgi:hypothetical protein